jgi:ribosomal protein L7/L12
MRDGGTSPHDVCLIAIAAGLSDIQQIRMLREVFDLSLVEAKEVMVVASGLGTSLDDYQARLIPSLLDAFAADDAEEE